LREHDGIYIFQLPPSKGAAIPTLIVRSMLPLPTFKSGYTA
jgi:hypothetical protein